MEYVEPEASLSLEGITNINMEQWMLCLMTLHPITTAAIPDVQCLGGFLNARFLGPCDCRRI